MTIRKLAPVALAAVLQVMPFTRMFTSGGPTCPCSFAILSRGLAGAIALLSAYDAVSGASSSLNSPTSATGTNGEAFSYRITTTVYYPVMRYSAAPLPPGLAMSGPFISGIPTNSGVFPVTLIVCATGKPTLVGPLTITIVDNAGAGPPEITAQPAGRVVTQGTNVTFEVTANGAAPLNYQWLKNDGVLAGATGSSLGLANVQPGDAGSYSVVVSNLLGVMTSSNAPLTVMPATGPPLMLRGSILDGQFTISFAAVSGQGYVLESNDTLGSNAWSAVTNLTAVTTNVSFVDSITNLSRRFFRVRSQ